LFSALAGCRYFHKPELVFWTGILSAILGFVFASAFSAIVVYARSSRPALT
jgi:hypothetical protein